MGGTQAAFLDVETYAGTTAGMASLEACSTRYL
jgi:hypothetical protein